MARVLVVYGTTEGQTRRIAERMAEQARGRGDEVALHDAAALPEDFDPGAFDGVVVAGSLHIGRHQSAVEHFVHHHLAALQARPSAFVSVSLSAAGDTEDRQHAQGAAEQFLAATGWRPTRTHLAAGAFRYTQYDFFKRWMMKRIAREKGASTDTSRDWELTDWAALERFMGEFLAALGPKASPAG